MNTQRPRRSLTARLLAALILYAISSPASTGAWEWPWSNQSCSQKCPACEYMCKISTKKVDEQHQRYFADSEVVCIPRVVFPWQTDECHRCENNGARLRRVNVLKRESYTCPRCEFSWSTKKRIAAANDDKITVKK